MMWGCRAAPCFFVRWGWQRYSRMTLGPSFHIMQPANTGWDVGVEDLCWSSLLIVSLGSRSDPFKYFLWRLQRHVENRKLVLKTPNNNSKKTWIHASSCCRDLPWEPQPSAVKGIYWNSPDPLHMVINYKMGNDEKTCKRTVAVFFWAIVWIHEWLMCSVLAEQQILCTALWSLGFAKTCRSELSLPGPRVLWLGSTSPWHCILFCTLESLGQMLLG